MMQGVKENWWHIPLEPDLIWEGYEAYCETEEYTPTEPEPEPQPTEPEPEITNETKINILYDASGSMGTTKDYLESMIQDGGALYQKLRPYYNSDAEYYARVQTEAYTSERFLLALRDNLVQSMNNINLVFQDEASFRSVDDAYHWMDWDINTPRSTGFETDMQIFRNDMNILSLPYHGVVFALEGNTDFQALLTAMETGDGQYYAPYGFSDLDYMNVKYNVTIADNLPPGTNIQSYYAELVKQALNDLGFNIP